MMIMTSSSIDLPTYCYNVLIVGSGVCGLMAAQKLLDAGVDVGVIEKSRGVGGRLATRRWTDDAGRLYRVDHGAQYFTIKNDALKPWAADWLEKGVIQTWPGVHPTDVAYAAKDGMTQLPKYLAQPLIAQQHLHTSQRAIRILPASGTPYRYQVFTEAGDCFECNQLIITAPMPQTLELLTRSNLPLTPDELSALSAITYVPCIGLLGNIFSDHVSNANFPESGGLKFADHPVLGWVGENGVKGFSHTGPAFTVHANAHWSGAHWDESDDNLTAQLIEAAALWIPPDAWQYTVIKKWRYSQVTQPHPAPMMLLSLCSGIMLAGDGFSETAPRHTRVEDAMLSGFAAAAYCLTQGRLMV